MNQNACLQKYQAALTQIPAPGGGGCHAALLGVANHGVKAGVDAKQMLADIRQHIPKGGRVVTDSEIAQAINKAGADLENGVEVRPRPEPVIDGERFLRAAIRDGQDIVLDDLLCASPVDTQYHTEGDLNRQIDVLLDALYTPDERLFIGEQHDSTIKTVADWKTLALQSHIGPHIIPNPLTGEQGQTKDGKPSYRADSCVAAFRFAVVEFDTLSMKDQISFWGAVDLPVAVLIFSGGKSIHAWLKVDCRDAAEWQAEIEDTLYARYLTPMGVDSSCRNEARLSRLPGVYRQDKGEWQTLLYLSPEGRPPCTTL